MESTAKSKRSLSQRVLNNLQEHFTQHPCDKIVIAYSGGVDSHVLLHSLALARHAWTPFPDLQAVHIHHGLNTEADQWQNHCQRVCSELSVCYESVQVRVDQEPGVSLEAEARRSRYQALAPFIDKNTVLVTAQHQDDQAETLLLQLIRGSGIDGLSAMPKSSAFSQGWQCRPLLAVSKQEIIAYAKENGLQWVEDSSNHDRKHARNYLRHEVMPLLSKRWPSVHKTLSRSAQHCADSAALIERLIQPLYDKAFDAQHKTLSIQALEALPSQERNAVLRFFIQSLGFLQPSTQKLAEIQRQLLQARDDANPTVQWSCCEMRRYRDRLYLMSCLVQHDVSQRIDWELTQKSINIEPLGQLILQQGEDTGLDSNKLKGQKLSIRFRQGGEKIKLAGREGHHDLKKLFQECGVAPWLRDRLPLIYVGEVLAMAVGIGINADFFVSKNGLKIQWQPSVNIDNKEYQ